MLSQGSRPLEVYEMCSVVNFALGLEQIANFWWQNNTIPIIPPYKVRQRSCCFLCTVLMYEVARLWKNLQLILTLHLTNHKLFIKSICPCQDKQLTTLGRQEFARKAGKPIRPKRLGLR